MCEDQTFHPEICLVGLEPVSNFILLEHYAENRSVESWTMALTAALSGLPVPVIQATSDKAKGLCKPTSVRNIPRTGFTSNTTSPKLRAYPLRARSRPQSKRWPRRRRAGSRSIKPARPTNPTVRRDAHPRLNRPWRELINRWRWRSATCNPRKPIKPKLKRYCTNSYHPYDLDTGQIQPSERVAGRLQGCWQTLHQLVRAANPPERCQEQIRKAQRLTGSLLATLSFFFATVQVKIEALNLPLEVETAVYHSLIPAIYLERVADKTAAADLPQTLRQRAASLIAPLNQPGSALASLHDEGRRLLESGWPSTVRTCSSAVAPVSKGAMVSSPYTITLATGSATVSSRR